MAAHSPPPAAGLLPAPAAAPPVPTPPSGGEGSGLPALRPAGDPPLNDEQRTAAMAPPDRSCLVLSGAGTGKTKTLAARYGFLVGLGVPRGRIMTVAFNRGAAEEMDRRISAALGRAPALNGTFHSLGLRMLRKHAAAFGFQKEPLVLKEAAARKLLREIALEAETGQGLDAAAVHKMIQEWKNRGVEPEAAADEAAAMPSGPPDGTRAAAKAAAEEAAELYRLYQARNRAAERVDFGDMVLLPARGMEADDSLRRKIAGALEHVLVDEFQDANPAQHRLLEALSSFGARLFCVGDDDQAIYGWRQADLDPLRTFEERHTGAGRVVLVKNYRSSPEIVEAANAILDAMPRRIAPKRLVPTEPSGDTPTASEHETREDEAEDVVRAILARREAGARLSSIAVLSRTNRRLRAVADRLAAAGVPVETRGGSFWERPEILDMLAYLEAVEDPSNAEALRRIANAPSRGVGKAALDALQAAAARRGTPIQDYRALGDLKPAQQRRLGALLDQLRDWRRAFKKGLPLDALLSKIGVDSGYSRHLAKDPADAVERQENIAELVGAARTSGTIDALLRLRDQARRERERTGEDGVVLSTIHRAKGAEWDHVFLVCCDAASMPHRLAASAAEIDEERRLAYVAFTRARRRLDVSWSWEGDGPSDYLHDAAERLETRAPAGAKRRVRPAAGRREPAWAQTLGVSAAESEAKVEGAYRRHAMTAHPDLGGSAERMVQLNIAILEARAWFASRAARAA